MIRGSSGGMKDGRIWTLMENVELVSSEGIWIIDFYSSIKQMTAQNRVKTLV